MKARIADIVAIASEVTGVPTTDITGDARFRHIMRARQACYFVARQQGYTYPMIGRRLGRDHSSVLQGCRVVSNLLDRRDICMVSMIERITARIAELRPFEAAQMQSSPAILARALAA